MGYAPTFIGNARTSRTRMIRELLAIYVSFMAATGMRAGTEAEFLEWRHIDVEVRDNQPILHFRLQRGKRGARNFVAHHSCWLLLELGLLLLAGEAGGWRLLVGGESRGRTLTYTNEFLNK